MTLCELLKACFFDCPNLTQGRQWTMVVNFWNFCNNEGIIGTTRSSSIKLCLENSRMTVLLVCLLCLNLEIETKTSWLSTTIQDAKKMISLHIIILSISFSLCILHGIRLVCCVIAVLWHSWWITQKCIIFVFWWKFACLFTLFFHYWKSFLTWCLSSVVHGTSLFVLLWLLNASEI